MIYSVLSTDLTVVAVLPAPENIPLRPSLFSRYFTHGSIQYVAVRPSDRTRNKYTSAACDLYSGRNPQGHLVLFLYQFIALLINFKKI